MKRLPHAAAVAMIGLCASVLVTKATEVPDPIAASNNESRLRLSLNREASGDVVLSLNVTANEAALDLLAKTKDVPVVLTADQEIPYGDMVKVVDMLHSLGIKTIAVDAAHKAGSSDAP